MSDPRLNVSYTEAGALFLTFKIDNSTITYSATANGGSSQVGLAVKLSAADTIALAGAGAGVLGKLIKVEADNMATVQVAGGMTLAAGANNSGNNALTLGEGIVGDVNGSGAAGYIKGQTRNAWNADVLVARGVCLDVGTTTAIEVLL